MEPTRYKPIGDYGVIGNLCTVALVGKDGSIDWCCMPDFDSPSVFATLLDAEKGGMFRIMPDDEGVTKHLYLPETNVLLTRFLCQDGVGECVDFMPLSSTGGRPTTATDIVREVRATRGIIHFRLVCRPAFDYARAGHTLEIVPGGAVFHSGSERLGLSSPVNLSGRDDGVEATFVLREGESLTFLLRRLSADSSVPLIEQDYDGTRALESTIDYWRRWASAIRYRGRWRETVIRSALALKLMTFEPTGAVVAAPTTSLPEEIGGTRNWDYRYTWIRDAAFTMYAFIRLGLTQEAGRFMAWIDDRSHENARDGSLQIMYGIRGEHSLPEIELPHLEGYRGSAPVRIGNAAAEQLQLDIYGELMDAVYLSDKYGRRISFEHWEHLRELLDYVIDNWTEKDAGIWEIRSGRHHMVYSKLMCWVALDRGLRLAVKRSFPAPQTKWLEARDRIYEDIMTKGWHSETGTFVQHYDTDALDASNLIMPLVFFMAPTDPRMISTLDATMSRLVSDSLVYRYETNTSRFDGLPGREGTFNMCTFWLVEALTRAGRVGEARLIFEKMLTYANDLGLYAEQTGPTGEALGNFPQAFTHMGLISAAFNLDLALDR